MGITNTQEGVITEGELAKIVIVTTNGQLVPARPLADDEGRDFEIHVRRRFRESLALQAKTSKRLYLRGKSRTLQIHFATRDPLTISPRYWYFFAHFDVKTIRFTDPVFLVPSAAVRRHAVAQPLHGAARYQFQASLEPWTKDKWSRYRLPQAQLGPRILEILRDIRRKPVDPKLVFQLPMPSIIWIENRPRRVSSAGRAAA